MLIQHIMSFFHRVPRIGLLVSKKEPIFDLSSSEYVQGVLLWSLIPVLFLIFWVCFILVHSCVWCCFHTNQRYSLEKSSRMRFYSRLTMLIFIICHCLSLLSISVLVYGSEMIHKSSYVLLDSLNKLENNLTSLVTLSSQAMELANQTSSRRSSANVELYNSIQQLTSSLHINEFTTKLTKLHRSIQHVENVRWYCVVAFVCAFAFVCLLLFRVCCSRGSTQMKWSSACLTLLGVFANILLGFYLVATIALSDICSNVEKTTFNLLKSKGTNSQSTVTFSHFTNCTSRTSDMRNSLCEHADLSKNETILSNLCTLLDCRQTSKCFNDSSEVLCSNSLFFFSLCLLVLFISSFTIPLSSLVLCYANRLQKMQRYSSRQVTKANSRLKRGHGRRDIFEQATAPDEISDFMMPMIPKRKQVEQSSPPPRYEDAAKRKK